MKMKDYDRAKVTSFFYHKKTFHYGHHGHHGSPGHHSPHSHYGHHGHHCYSAVRPSSLLSIIITIISCTTFFDRQALIT